MEWSAWKCALRHFNLLTLIFYGLKVQRGALIISGTIKASQMKPCTVIVLLKTFQNTKRKIKKSYLWRPNDVITKNNGKFGPPRNQTNYISLGR